jgi:hypothetical protein
MRLLQASASPQCVDSGRKEEQIFVSGRRRPEYRVDLPMQDVLSAKPMRERSQAEIRRDAIRLVVVNEEPERPSVECAAPEEALRDPDDGNLIGGVDSRIIDLAAMAFTIALAFLLAYLFNSLNHADRILYCIMAGATNCS